MDESQGGGKRKKAAEDLILRTIAAHADSLLRTARRHSICIDDAQDAYQRAIELFMSHAPRLDAARAPGWLHVVVKREAQAIQRSRRKILMTTEIDLDGQEAVRLPTPEEQLLRFDLISRSAEALKRLKPHELRALWLRAEGVRSQRGCNDFLRSTSRLGGLGLRLHRSRPQRSLEPGRLLSCSWSPSQIRRTSAWSIAPRRLSR